MCKKVIAWGKKLFKCNFTICGLLNPADSSPNKKILITRPDHDPTTAYLFAWTEPIIDLVSKSQVFGLIDLAKEQANKNNFLDALKKEKPVFIFLNGHGSGTTVAGYNNEPLVVMGNNEDLFKDKVVYALACKSGRTLGRWLVGNGTKVYLGYEDDFIFIIDEAKVANPLTDETAKLYLEPSNILVSSLITGSTAGEAYQESQNKYQEHINEILTSESQEDDKDLLPYLFWDKEHQVCLGDKEAKI